jgi:pimeloyl-ACP methyl ester carboxylesterase
MVNKITPRTLFISGENDGPFPKALSELASLLPSARYAAVPKAGHLPNIQNPKEFNALITHHFK